MSNPEPMDAHAETQPVARRAAAGDAEAFERLYRSTVARVHGLARRLVGQRDADEATQEVYLRAWRKLGTFRGESEFATWLQRLATRALLTRRARARTRGDAREGELDPDVHAAPSPPASGLAEELELALERLPSGAREVFVLHEVEGLAHAEIAQRLGVTIGTSKSQLSYARKLLRSWLLARGERP